MDEKILSKSKNTDMCEKTNMCKFESSQKDESRAQSADSSKACRKPKDFNCLNKRDKPTFSQDGIYTF